MDPNDIEVAIQITWSHGGDPTLRAQALNFVNDLRTNATAWSPCLALFTRPNPPADEPVRHFCLEVVCNCIPHLDVESLELMKGQLTRYVEERYGGGGEDTAGDVNSAGAAVGGAGGRTGDDGRTDTGPIQNKLCQALTVLFVQLYPTSWVGFFSEFLALTKQGSNTPGTLLYFRLLLSIHDEIGDIIINREVDQSNRNVTLKDLVRERDAEKIALFWQEMLARKEQLDLHVLELCLKSVSRWISWSDISLVVNQMVLNALLELASQQGLEPGMIMQTKVRDAALEAFTEIASKKMRPSEKVELIQVLKLETVISQLIASPGLMDLRNTSKYDTDLAELVAKLVNNIVRDIVVVLDSAEANEQTKATAHEILLTFLPFLLRFFSDEYDEVCSMVIDGLSEVLGFLRRISKEKLPVAQTYGQILPSFLQAIVGKMKYDETANWEEDEDAEEVEFVELRRRLQALQKQVFAIDEQMTIMGISQLVQQTFRKVAENPEAIDWRELDLALYELNSFGDFAVKPAAIVNPQRGGIGVEQLRVMMEEMMTCKIGEYDHPAIQVRFAENCVRYAKFFETSLAAYIPVALECFVRYSHSGTPRLRGQTWYHFLRFVKNLRKNLGAVSEQIIHALADLLVIRAVLPSDLPEDEDSSSDVTEYEDSQFNSQVALFEAIGCVASSAQSSTEQKVVYIQSIMNPMFVDVEQNLPLAKAGDERAVLQIHHDIMAAGSFAHGFKEWNPGMKSVDAPPSEEVAAQFIRCGEVVLVALESLKQSKSIRSAARHTLSRLLGCTGTGLFSQLPRWVDCIISPSSSKEEISFFIRLLAQIVFAFKTEIAAFATFLGENLPLLLGRVFDRMTEQAMGTDDENELGELRREFLSFIMVCLNNGLGTVFIQPRNQAVFEKTVGAVEDFARDPRDLHTARLALATITRMIATWAGKSAVNSGKTNGAVTNGPNGVEGQEEGIPGFDTFAISRLSPLAWAIPASPQFKPGDAGGRLLLQEVAAMQHELYKRTGMEYGNALRDQLLAIGVQEADVQVYLEKLSGDAKGFKEFLVGFLGGR